jgi:hypothetical protein
MSDQIRPLRAKAMANLSREHTLARRVTLWKSPEPLTERRETSGSLRTTGNPEAIPSFSKNRVPVIRGLFCRMDCFRRSR